MDYIPFTLPIYDRHPAAIANKKPPASVEMTIDQFIKYNTTFKAPERFGNWLKPTGRKRPLTKIKCRPINSSLSWPVFGNHQYFTHSVWVPPQSIKHQGDCNGVITTVENGRRFLPPLFCADCLLTGWEAAFARAERCRREIRFWRGDEYEISIIFVISIRFRPNGNS